MTARLIVLAFLVCPSSYAYCAAQGERRSGKFERLVNRVEARADALEESSGRKTYPEKDRDSLKTQPLRVSVLKRKQTITRKRAGIELTIQFENLTDDRLNGFSGKLVLKPDSGGIYFRKIAHLDFMEPGGKTSMVFVISSDDVRTYLRFVKASEIKIVFVEQRLF